MQKILIKINKKQLLLLQESYKTDKDIAKHLGVTRQYIHYLRKKYEVELIKSSTVKINRNKLIYSAFKRGMTRQELSNAENLSYLTICRIIKKMTI